MDSQSHPILNDIKNCYIHPILDGQSHPIMDGIDNCYIHPIMDGRSHPIMEVNDCHPKVDGQFRPFLDIYWSFCLSIGEKSKKTSIFGCKLFIC